MDSVSAPELRGAAAGILHKYKCRVKYATTDKEATTAIAAVIADAVGGLIGIDTETTPHESERRRLAELRQMLFAARGTSKAAERLRGQTGQAVETLGKALADLKNLAAQVRYAESAALDPHRSSIRLLQAYGGGETVAVIDMARVGWAALAPLWEAPLVAHNAVFDAAFLYKAGVEPKELHCTMQASRLLHGPNVARLADAAATVLGIELDKTQQTSDWGARRLTIDQVHYAAVDAVVVWHLADRMLPRLAERANAYEIQMMAIPPVARMQLRGFRLDTEAHARLMVDLTADRREAETAYLDACRECGRDDLVARGMPSTSAGKEALLNALLSSDKLANWKRTAKAGRLSTKRSELRRAAHYKPIGTLSRVAVLDKQLDSFGTTLAAYVSPVTGRIHASYNVAGTVSGRAACSRPNLQQIPKDARFRKLFVAEPGCVLVGADYGSMELRAAAEKYGDEDMREAFRRGDDLHSITAATVTGKALKDIPREGPERNAAKRVNFGAIYGSGTNGLMKSVWDAYGLAMTITEAGEWLRGFAATYPTLVRGLRQHADRCAKERRIVIGREAAEGIGRVFEMAWLPPDRHTYTVACNLPIQGVCADIAMQALAYVDDALFMAGIDGGPVAWTHDEITLEVREKHAEAAGKLLTDAMTRAFAETFPSAPLDNLVKARIGADWAALKD